MSRFMDSKDQSPTCVLLERKGELTWRTCLDSLSTLSIESSDLFKRHDVYTGQKILSAIENNEEGTQIIYLLYTRLNPRQIPPRSVQHHT